MPNEISLFTPDAVLMPGQSEWTMMQDMAAQLVPTGLLPSSIKTPAQAVAIMLQARESRVPMMYGFRNISIVQGKPVISAEMMLAMIYRDYGKSSFRVKSSDNTQCTVEYRLPGWGDVQSYSFRIEDAKTAGLAGKDTWKAYPAALLRARCISATARMAFPESIGGMYVSGELGEDVTVDSDGVVHSVSVSEIPPTAIEAQSQPVDNEERVVKEKVWKLANTQYGWSLETLNEVAQHMLGATVSEMGPAGLDQLHGMLITMDTDQRKAISDGTPVADVLTGVEV